MRSLEARGVITGYSAVLDPASLGWPMQIFIGISLQQQTTERVALFESAIAKMPAALECYLMAGETDHLLKVVAASLDQYLRFVVEPMGAVPGIGSTRSLIPLKHVKSGAPLPV